MKKKKVFTCEWCSSLFWSHGKMVRYCSRECRTMGMNIKKRDSIKKNAKCRECRRPFSPATSTQIFCTKKCSDKWHDRKADEKRKPFYFEIFKRDNFRCIYCGRSPVNDKKVILEVDHVYPRNIGGGNDPFNLVTSCRKCNQQKKDMYLGYQQTLILWREIDRRNRRISNDSYDEMARFFEKCYPRKMKK